LTVGVVPSPAAAPGDVSCGLTVYGCEPDEAVLFDALAPRFGIVPTITGAAVSASAVISVPANRCVSVGHKSELTARELRALRAAGVEHVSTRSIGFDHIDLDAAAALGITVENVVYDPDGVADFTVMLILMLVRNVQHVVRAAANHDFRLGRVRGKDLRDLTVGVVGVGNIGRAVIRRLHGFGCRVLADNNGQETSAAAEFVSRQELLRMSDVVTLHTPLTADTHHLIGRDALAAMKPGAYVVNTGRGALVDTEALVVALERGTLGGAALDVLEGEDGIFYVDRTSDPIDHPLLLRLQQLPNAIVTPHTAYYTERALHDTVEKTLIKALDFERNRAHAETHDRDPVRRMLGGA
jgi:D-specific alpha-keto acid dehydrogenase